VNRASMADRSPLAIFAIRTSSVIVCIAEAPALSLRQPARSQVQRSGEKDLRPIREPAAQCLFLAGIGQVCPLGLRILIKF
jgi:hypothetical protein